MGARGRSAQVRGAARTAPAPARGTGGAGRPRGTTSPADRRARPSRDAGTSAALGLLGATPRTATGRTLTALVAGTPLVFWRGLDSTFAAPKLLFVCAAVVVLLVVPRPGAERAPKVVWPPALVAVIVFVVLLVSATILSDAPALSVIGHHDRYAGLVTYVTVAVLFLRVATVDDVDDLAPLVPGVGIAALLVALYGLLQWVNLDPFSWSFAYEISGVASTLGNPNFAAAHVATGMVVGVGVLLADPTRRARHAAWVLVAFGGFGALAAESIQGYLAAAAGITVTALAWAIRRRPERRVGYLLTTLGVGVVGVAAVGAGAAGVGPLGILARNVGTRTRLWDWQAALAIGADHPGSGVGLERFVGYANAYRPAEAADTLGPEILLDTPHDVPLSMLVGGGWPLFVAYLAFVGVVGWALVSGLGRLEGREHRLLGILGGVWVAYQVQSLVSIDVPSLVSLHWLVAGAIVALVTGSRARAVPMLDAPRWRTLRRPAAVVAALAAVGLLVVPVGRVVLADAAAGAGWAAFGAGDGDAAVDAAERAVDRAPWEPRYGELLGFAHGEAGDGEAALDALLAAAEADPRALSPQLNVARLAAAMQRDDLAAARYRVVLQLEPHHVGLHAEAAGALGRIEGPAAALEVAEGLVARRPTSAEARQLRDELAGGVTD